MQNNDILKVNNFDVLSLNTEDLYVDNISEKTENGNINVLNTVDMKDNDISSSGDITTTGIITGG